MNGKLLAKVVSLRPPTSESPRVFIKKQVSAPNPRPLEPEFEGRQGNLRWRNSMVILIPGGL